MNPVFGSRLTIGVELAISFGPSLSQVRLLHVIIRITYFFLHTQWTTSAMRQTDVLVSACTYEVLFNEQLSHLPIAHRAPAGSHGHAAGATR
jgi:hypothetical protein